MIIGLSFSGGGFRASLFHLGVIRRLRAEGLLNQVTRIASVSGGSITAAHLLSNWDKYNSTVHDFDDAANELISLTKIDLRGRIQRRLPFMWLLGLVPFGSIRITPTRLLAKYYDKYLFHGASLALDTGKGSDDCKKPKLLVLSTNLSEASLTAFTHKKILDIPLESMAPVSEVPAELIPLAEAVAASSAYPGFFAPLELNDFDVGAQVGTFGKKYFTDAGIFDNLGVYGLERTTRVSLGEDRSASSDNGEEEFFDMILASDAGRSFVPQTETQYGLLRTALRAVDIFMFRIRQFDLSKYKDLPAIQGSPRASKFRLISISDRAETDGAASSEIQSQLESIRTDLDKFSHLEITELVRHGYYVTAKQVAKTQGKSTPVEIPEWDPPNEASLGISGQQKFQLGKKLQRGARRQWRLFSAADWVSWLQLAIASSLLVILIALSGHIFDYANGVIAGIRAYPLIKYDPPAWTNPRSLIVQPTSSVLQPSNEGFNVLSDDRVWDLRQLRGTHRSGGVLKITGPMLMTRVSKLIRRDATADQYSYLYLTAASDFAAWSPDASAVRLLRSDQQTTSGTNLLTSYELQLDVSDKEVGKPFLLQAQAKTVDAPWDRNNTWIGMRITDGSPAASMRIIFPADLPFKRPAFLKYPNDSALPSQTFDGIVLDRKSENELLWRIDHPQPGWTYRVQWDWE